jgi:predicted glycoside hydrolase/deacetylase ChbG (UPF0249 family)
LLFQESKVQILAMRTLTLVVAVAATLGCRQAPAPMPTPAVQGAPLLLRLDDVGMNHSVNMAIKRIAESGIPFSVSVLFVCPWHQEAVEILKQNPQISVGVHLALNSEWKNYRWGPVLGAATVPSLVDSNGYFVHSNERFRSMRYDLGEVERELNAQMDRAMRSGLKIDYVDYHMGTVLRSPEVRELVERLAREFGLGMSEYFGEARSDPQYAAEPRAKGDSLQALIGRLQPGFNLLVTHVGIDNEELGALLDMNTDGGLAEMSKNRQGELNALTSPRFRDALAARGVKLVTYRQVIEMQGLARMRRPGG